MKSIILKLIIILVVSTISIVSTVYLPQPNQPSLISLASLRSALADDEGGGSGINCASTNPCQVNYNTKFDDQLVAIACCERYNYGSTGYYH